MEKYMAKHRYLHFLLAQLTSHRRSQGVQWVHLHPPGRWKKFFFRRNLQGKCVSAPPENEVHPPARARVNFYEFLLGGLDLEVYLDIFRRFFEGDD